MSSGLNRSVLHIDCFRLCSRDNGIEPDEAFDFRADGNSFV
jgi:hypothetical protein